MEILKVRVEPDHLRRLASVRQPIRAVSELIWNSLDADATEVSVELHRSLLGAIERIVVTDNGSGMTIEDARAGFRSLGGSWKRSATRTRREERILHGRQGKGRFRAFALGHQVEWRTVVQVSEGVMTFAVNGEADSLGEFKMSDPTSVEEQPPGTVVTITDVPTQLPSLDPTRAIPILNEEFANYLRQYKNVSIRYMGELLDPSTLEANVTHHRLGPITVGDRDVEPFLTIVEWATEMERGLYLCDENGFALERMPPGIQAPGFHFTAYVKHEILREMDEEGLLFLEPLNPDLNDLLVVVRDIMRDHFRERAAFRAREVVETWKREEVYPYVEEPESDIERMEREVFDILAVNVNEYVPDFADAPKASKQFSLRLLRQALEESPESLQRIFEEVLDLPPETRDDFAHLIRQTSLPLIITASRTVTNRLNFVRGIEELIYAPELKAVVKERAHLHKLLEQNTWLFGEEFHLTNSDESLTAVLKKHRPDLVDVDVDQVVRDDGRIGIVDVVLGRRAPTSNEQERDYLVLELKRPSKRITKEVYQQIEDYAFAVAGDERFHEVEARWNFVALSSSVDSFVQRKATQRDRPKGLVHDDEVLNLRIWVKPWSQVLNEAKARLAFFRKQLEYDPGRAEGLRYLRELYREYLPDEVVFSDGQTGDI